MPEATPETTGRLAEGVLPRLLRHLYVGRKTGLLHFTRGEDRASVCFMNGHIVWGDSTIEECHMGPILLRHGLLAPGALNKVTDLVGGGKRLGEVLLEFGLIDKKTLDQALALQVRELLLAAFNWPEGSFEFEEHPPERFKGYDQALDISTGELVLDAVWSVRDPDVIRYSLGDIDRVLVLTTDPLLRFQRVTLTPIDGFILSRVDGMLSAREVLAIAPVSPEEAQRSLFGLLCIGMLEYEPAAPVREEPRPAEASREEVLEAYRGLATRDHFQVLGLTQAASEAEVKAAYHRLVRRFHPDIHHRQELAELHSQIAAIFERLGTAAKVLSDPQARAEYKSTLMVARFKPKPEPAVAAAPAPQAPDPFVDVKRAEEMLQAAEESHGQGRYWDAIQQAQQIVASATGRVKPKARLLLARCYLKNPEWRKSAEDELKAVLQEDPGSADAYFHLGTLYKGAGLTPRARAMFRKALELKPRHAAAQAELQSLGPEKPPKAGLLKKLLR